MKRNAMILCCALLAGCGEKAPVDDTFSDLAGADEKSDKFTGRMTVNGEIKYGDTKSFQHTASPLAKKWSTYKFLGSAGDELTIDVKSANGDTVAWLVDKSMEILAFDDDSGDGTNSLISHTLKSGANTTFFIVVREYSHRSMRAAVTLKGKKKNFSAPCTRDAECVMANAACCGGNWVAVRADLADAFHQSLNCNPLLRCAVEAPPSDVMAECVQNKCTAVNVADIQCGGFTINPHACPEGYECTGDGLARDLPGECTPIAAPTTCGGIAGRPCAGDQICVDNPYDDCDPSAGGADCGGECRDAICSGATARCAAGYHWDQWECNCLENTFCGGIAGFPCPAGKECVDNPRDNCDPRNGGADCGGICVEPDCRRTGCGTGQYCTFCWVSYQCIPQGAVC